MNSNGGNSTCGPVPATDDAAAMLREIDDIRCRTRRDTHPFWFPLVLFGALSILATPFCGIGDGTGISLFWAVAGPVGGAVTAFYYRRHELHLGAGVSGVPYVLIALFIMAGAFLLGSQGSGTVSSAGPMAVVAIGYLGFARLERSWNVAFVAAGMLAVTVVVALANVQHDCEVLSATFGGAFLLTGLSLRQGKRGG